MKKILCLFLLVCTTCFNTPVFATSNLRIYAEKLDGYSFRTALKHYQPYTLTLINNNKDTIYLSASSEVQFEDEHGKIHAVPNEKTIYQKSRKREVGRYFWVSLPSAAAGGFITGASFFLLAIPGIGLAVAGSIYASSALKYNSRFAQDYYIDNSLPLNLKNNMVSSVYIFLPKGTNPQKIIITNLSTDKKKSFDISIPVL